MPTKTETEKILETMTLGQLIQGYIDATHSHMLYAQFVNKMECNKDLPEAYRDEFNSLVDAVINHRWRPE